MTRTITRLAVHAVDPLRLDAVRSARTDGHGNPFRRFPASGSGEPLRCCLRYATPGEPIALISFAPFTHVSPWTEVGPVYVHGDRCAGYDSAAGLPAELRSGPVLLRTYHPDDSMDYEHNTLITDGRDLEATIEELLALPDVATVHVRTARPQCFLYAVTRLPSDA
jgi:hypothetical protein